MNNFKCILCQNVLVPIKYTESTDLFQCDNCTFKWNDFYTSQSLCSLYVKDDKMTVYNVLSFFMSPCFFLKISGDLENNVFIWSYKNGPDNITHQKNLNKLICSDKIKRDNDISNAANLY